MLSILIPTYNYDCYELVKELHRQATSLNIPFEILVADDASLEENKTENRKINNLSYSKFIEFKVNKGRSRIRNFLGEEAQYPYLLFMDCDARIEHSCFLKNYLEAREKAEVIIGGLSNPKELPAQNLSLRYYYEQSILQKRNLIKKNSDPYSQFTTFCFLIRKECFLKIKFNPVFTKYGHEDTFFGIELKKQNVSILHIYNPLCHMGLEENSVFLEKTLTSINSLVEHKQILKESSHLYIVYSKMNKFKLTYLFFLFYKLFQKIMENNLLGTHPNMKIFAIYKLGYLCYREKQLNK